MKRYLWQQIPSPLVSELLISYNMFDGVVLDTEHGCFNKETLFNCIQILTKEKGKECLVRLTDINKDSIRHCLDAGASGLIFSTIEKFSQVEMIVEECHYPDQGGTRGLGLCRDNFWGAEQLTRPKENKPILIAQIETVKGAHEILLGHINTNHFDYIMIGPYDLSASLNCAGDFDNPSFKQLIKELTDAITYQKLGYHIVTNVEKQLPNFTRCGFLAWSMDVLMITERINQLNKLILKEYNDFDQEETDIPIIENEDI